MLEYLVIVLDDTSVSYCHSCSTVSGRNLMEYEVLKAGIIFAMKENLHIQFVYPDYDLPVPYLELIHSVDHSDIKPVSCADSETDVVVIDTWEEFSSCSFMPHAIYVLRTGRKDFFRNNSLVNKVLGSIKRLNIIILDIEEFDDDDFAAYERCLRNIAAEVEKLYSEDVPVQLNLLTDRMMLDSMNNCDAGSRSITLAPNGRFYVCPAFYFQNPSDDAGNLSDGLRLKNQQLYKLDYAPLCRKCDSYQCRRCVWLNRRMTSEVNVPSHEQCVTAHIERNISAELLPRIRPFDAAYKDRSIKEISYLDPLDVYKKQ